MLTLHVTSSTGRRPSRLRWFVTSALVAVIGIVAAAVWATAGMLDVTNSPTSFVRLQTPGTTTIQLAQGAHRVVYLEGPRGAPLVDPSVTVNGPDGAAIPLTAHRATLLYDTGGGGIGQAVGSFTARLSGPHQVTAAAVPGVTVAVGDDLAGHTLHALAGPAIVAGASVLLAIILAAAPFATRPSPTRRTP